MCLAIFKPAKAKIPEAHLHTYLTEMETFAPAMRELADRMPALLREAWAHFAREFPLAGRRRVVFRPPTRRLRP